MYGDLSLLLRNDDKALLCGFQSGFEMWFVIHSSKETIEDRYCSVFTVVDIPDSFHIVTNCQS